MHLHTFQQTTYYEHTFTIEQTLTRYNKTATEHGSNFTRVKQP